jgi:predicted amidophosphoribosyltransferase
MQSTRICPTCHRTVDSSQQYCPFCRNPVDPALLDELRWMYRALQDLDRRITLGEGSTTIQALRDEINADYLAKRTASGAA